MSMLGLNKLDSQIAQNMITGSDSLIGFDITNIMGPVEGVVEKSFVAMSVGSIGVVDGGGLEEMLFDAKQKLARAASEVGANAVVAFRYTVIGRNLEKSVVAYGTAVKCQKCQIPR